MPPKGEEKGIVDLLDEASIAATVSVEGEGKQIAIGPEGAAVTVRCTFGAGSAAGITVILLSSIDGINWDTQAWVDLIEPDFVTDSIEQVTTNLDPLPKYIKAKVTNNDLGVAVTDVTVTLTKNWMR